MDAAESVSESDEPEFGSASEPASEPVPVPEPEPEPKPEPEPEPEPEPGPPPPPVKPAPDLEDVEDLMFVDADIEADRRRPPR